MRLQRTVAYSKPLREQTFSLDLRLGLAGGQSDFSTGVKQTVPR